MKYVKYGPLFTLAFLVLLQSFKPAAQDPWYSKFLTIQPDGTLIYHPDEKGNILPDFSRVGYHHGNQAIPDVKIVKTISSNEGGNQQQLIQNAIDEVSGLNPDKNGFRGAILIKSGIYKIPGTLNLKKSGIVLRGEGDEENGTKLVATGAGQRSLLKITGTGKATEIPGSRTNITDQYVPVGTFSFNVADAKAFKAGDKVILYRPGTQNWITDLKMDQIVAKADTKQWTPEEYNLAFEREVVKTEGTKVYLDNPVVMEMDQKYGVSSLYKYEYSGRIHEVGVENIRFESEYKSDVDEDHGWTAVDYSGIENGWVRNVTARYFGYSAVKLGSSAKNITVKDSRCLDAKSIITGGRRYSFNNDGQQNLFMNLQTTEGRHDFVTGAKTLGPNVFIHGSSTHTHADIGPHHRWAVGTLYDNITTDGEINVQDRGDYGTGHGWSGVTQILWNCTVKRAAVQNPWVSGNNYSIGLKGEKSPGRFKDRNDGVWEGNNKKGLTPGSLYEAQLTARKR